MKQISTFCLLLLTLPFFALGAEVLEADFDSDENGFTYSDDVFRSTSEPGYASGSYQPSGGFTGGGLKVDLGNKDSADIFGMSGGWQSSFVLTSLSDVVIQFRYKLDHAANYEIDEYADVTFSVDSTLYGMNGNDYVDKIIGDGQGGALQTTGWKLFEITIPSLSAGSHTVVFGAYSNLKTYPDELTEAYIDDVLITAANSIPDSEAPTVSIDFPSDTSIVVNTINILASATDNVAVARVTFFIDGVEIGVDTIAPYSFEWNTKSIANGVHEIMAIGRDGSGNEANDRVDVVIDNLPSAEVLEADFDSDENGFTYSDDVFRSTSEPGYASGSYQPSGGFTGGGLKVDLGNKDSADIFGMSGGWQSSFVLTSLSDVVIQFRYKLDHAANYEIDEYADVTFSVDSTLYGMNGNDYVDKIIGDGQGGALQTTGWKLFEITIPSLSAGSHTVVFGAYSNLKTYPDELTEAYIDDVLITAANSIPDSEAPTVSIDFPSDTSIVVNTINILASATDNVAVARVTFFIDGVEIGVDTIAPYSFEWNTITTPNGVHIITVTARDFSGNEANDMVDVVIDNLPSSVIRREYVFGKGVMNIFDIDNGHSYIRTVNLPTSGGKITGAVASPVTGMLYVSYVVAGGSLLKYDLVKDELVWVRTYSDGVDSHTLSPDGQKIYMPTDTSGKWNILDADTGDIIDFIAGPTRPHNTIVSLDGKNVYMGGGLNRLDVADTSTNTIYKSVGPLVGRVRPFTINGTETLAYMTESYLFGFEVGDLITGDVLYTVNIQNFNSDSSDRSPSHGISLSPDETEIYVMDRENSYVHVFDVSNVPQSAPVQVADIALSDIEGGEGWIQHSRDGKYVYVGDVGDVIDTATRTVIAYIDALHESRIHIEIHFAGGVPVWAANSRATVGYVSD